MTAALPEGWTLQAGAGGWRAANPERGWVTIVYTEKMGGAIAAIAAAHALEKAVAETLRQRQRLCVELRAYFGGAPQ